MSSMSSLRRQFTDSIIERKTKALRPSKYEPYDIGSNKRKAIRLENKKRKKVLRRLAKRKGE